MHCIALHEDLLHTLQLIIHMYVQEGTNPIGVSHRYRTTDNNTIDFACSINLRSVQNPSNSRHAFRPRSNGSSPSQAECIYSVSASLRSQSFTWTNSKLTFFDQEPCRPSASTSSLGRNDTSFKFLTFYWSNTPPSSSACVSHPFLNLNPHIINPPEEDPSVFKEFFDWLHSSKPQVDFKGTEAISDLAIFAHK